MYGRAKEALTNALVILFITQPSLRLCAITNCTFIVSDSYLN